MHASLKESSCVVDSVYQFTTYVGAKIQTADTPYSP